MLRAAIVWVSLLIALPSSAMVRVASDRRATLSELQVLVEPGTWTVRARLDGSAREVALLLPVPGDRVTAEVVEPAIFDDLDHATAPRLRTVAPIDPCAAEPGTPEHSDFWPTVRSPSPFGYRALVIAPQRADQLAASLPGVTLDEDSSRALTRAVREGRRVVVLIGPAPGKLRGFWTPPIRIAADTRSLPLGFAAPHVTIGKNLRVDVFARGALAPKSPTADLPSDIFLPPSVREDPMDLLRAVTAQTVRREGPTTALRISSGAEVQRWFVEVGRRDERRVLELAEKPLARFTALWWIRSRWQAPLTCDPGPRYRNNLRIQEKTEIQTYAAITGRPQSSVRTVPRP